MKTLPRSGYQTVFLFSAALSAVSPALAQAATVSTPVEQRRQFDIPSQALNVALRTFAEVTGLQLVHSSLLVNGLKSTELKGAYGTNEALRILLSGTGLTFRIGTGNTVVIERQKTSDARMLGPVRVEGANESS